MGRYRRVVFAGALVSLAVGPLMAAEPKAVIVGPSTRQSGQSILLDARKSVSDKPLKWSLVSHPAAPFLTFDSAPRKNTYAFLPDPDPGSYTFAVTAIGKVGDELEADTALLQVTVGGPSPTPPGPGPQPQPNPPQPSPTPLGLHAYVMSQVAAIPAADRRGGAAAMAAAYGETLKLAREGRFATAQAMIDDARPRVQVVRTAWPSWFLFAVNTKLSELSKAGKIATIDDLKAAFGEIAGALEEVAGGR